MTRFVLRRLGISSIILLIGSFLMFILTINSGDPLEDLRESTASNRDQLMSSRIAYMGLNDPWYERYWDWFTGAAGCLYGECDLGVDRAGANVNALLTQAMGSTLRLVLIATFAAIVIGIIV